jgi:hypothetical protein
MMIAVLAVTNRNALNTIMTDGTQSMNLENDIKPFIVSKFIFNKHVTVRAPRIMCFAAPEPHLIEDSNPLCHVGRKK